MKAESTARMKKGIHMVTLLLLVLAASPIKPAKMVCSPVDGTTVCRVVR